MVPFDHIDLFEEDYTQYGAPSLGRAYTLLKKRWSGGGTDLETGLRLMFLAWYSYSCYEPPFLTGLPPDVWAPEVLVQVFDHFGGEATTEPEVLFAVGVMATTYPWWLADAREGQRFGRRCLARSRELKPEGFRAEHFAGRGAYGHFFSRLTRSRPVESRYRPAAPAAPPPAVFDLPPPLARD
jgi:hypothetical protein